ncbi:FxsA family protein [Marinomonas posidonica]|uniref:FxsA cytoplasmic membrane protein n=1 Tax=Marinomonas posidonica (strain CECT 7376 / NCIMB 14433 / IVIA-Po-181) TaxID=491952 RepID=F6CZ95_MARPP|nr:FxsA family protein [Marinomonas posidonica]AEF54632.1 FxsA cytoplasmic membrane protein [Marinomonas posidonica IVIA-Po-181]
MRFALLLFILVPIIEMTVLIQVGSEIGSLATVGLVFLTAIVGVSLIRKQGLETSLKAQEKMSRGELPASEVAEGVMLLFAGLCLLIPGFVTDAIGGLLLIPVLRKLFAAGLVVKLMSSVMARGTQWRTRGHYESTHEGEIIEGEYANEDNDLIDKK